MPGEDIYSWSTVAIDNGSADTLIIWVEGQTRASVNNSARGMMAAHAKNRKLLTGTIVTTGTANAQAFLSGNSYTTIPLNMLVRLKVGAGLTNTGSMTLNMDGIGNTLVVDPQGKNLRGGEFTSADYTELLWNGSNWVFIYSRGFIDASATGVVLSQQVFSTAGTATYTPSSGMACCIIECIGGGGGGGGAAIGLTSEYMVGGGGGAGAYSRVLKTAVDVGASQTMTVGAGGIAGVSGGPSGNGGNGGNTSIGTLCVAKGGHGGLGASSAQVAQGGQGGAAEASAPGEVHVQGTSGESGVYNNNTAAGVFIYSSGTGASSVLGGGPQSRANSGASAGFPAGNYGSGGGGGSDYGVVGNVNGAAGSPGVIIITEFAGRGLPGVDGAPGAPGPTGPVGPAGPGTGDVLRSGVPTAGQLAQWTDSSHITGVDAPTGFTTGDAKITLKTVADTGWVMMNDGTIGSATSGSSTRANADTQTLFILLFNNCNDTYAPILTSAGAATTRATQVNAATAWAANCRMSLTKQLGRALGVAGSGAGLTARALGATAGEESHVLATAELPSHGHGVNDPPHAHGIQQVPYVPSTIVVDLGSAQTVPVYGGNVVSTATAATGISIQATGSGTAHNVMQPSVFWNIMIKL